MFLTPSAGRRAVASILAGLFALATRAAAQDSQYWDIQYGPVGQLLGGQVVGSPATSPRPTTTRVASASARTRTSCSRSRGSRGRT